MTPKVIRSILALAFVLGLVLTVTPVALAASTIYVRPDGDDALCNGTVDVGVGSAPNCAYKTIQQGITQAVTGGTVHVANGTYAGQPLMYKSISLIGESEAGVILDASGLGGYGLEVSGDYNVTLKYLTLKGPTAAPGYGIKIAGENAQATIQHVTVKNSFRTGIDLNGLSGGQVDQVTLTSNGGVGLALTDCSNIIISNITTSGNAWGGVALYTKGATFTGGSNNIVLNGTNTFGETNKLYIEVAGGYPVTNFTQTDFGYVVRNGTSLPAYTFYQKTAGDAVAFALALPTPNKSTVQSTVDGSYYVGSGLSIQAAIDAAAPGDTINVAAGTYAESLNLNKRVTIIGVGSGAGGTVITGVIGGSGGVVQLSASGLSASQPILLKNLRIQPTGAAGISVGQFGETTATSVSYVELNNVKVVGTNTNPCTEQERGLFVGPKSSLTNLKIADSAFDNLHYGWYLQKEVSADVSTVQYVDVQNTTFNHNNTKGIYAEKLEDATFTNVTANQNGYDGSLLTAGGCGYFAATMAGIDVNLKAGTYQNLTFTNNTITNNALGGAKEGVGITVKARDDGATYGAFPATASNVSITGGLVAGNERGIRFGEPGKNNAGPTAVTVNNVCISNNVQTYSGIDGSAYGGLVNASLATTTATNNWWGSATGPTNPGNPGGTGDAVVGLVTFSPWKATGCPTTLGAATTDSIFCVGESTDVTIDIAQVVNLYGYQFTVNYTNPTVVTVAGAFVNTFFNTANPAFRAWDADCTTAGVCKFSVTRTNPQGAISALAPLPRSRSPARRPAPPPSRSATTY